MTHIVNVQHILKNGITHTNSLNANPDYITIGDVCCLEITKQRLIDLGVDGKIIAIRPDYYF